MLSACMANLQVKNVPEPLHRKLRRIAQQKGVTVSDFVLEAVDRAAAREDWKQRFARRSRVTLGRAAATTLAQVRAEREPRSR
jgi:plasmid stability protein